MILEPGYRLNVGLIIINDKGKLLLCKRKGTNNWQFPQGGIDDGETPLEAAKRELFEEVGIHSKSVALISSSRNWYKYDIPKQQRKEHFLKRRIKGQMQKWYMFKLKNSVGISFEHDPDNEFDDFKWVSYWYPMFKIIFFKKDVYRKVLGDMRYAYFDKGLL